MNEFPLRCDIKIFGDIIALPIFSGFLLGLAFMYSKLYLIGGVLTILFGCLLLVALMKWQKTYKTLKVEPNGVINEVTTLYGEKSIKYLARRNDIEAVAVYANYYTNRKSFDERVHWTYQPVIIMKNGKMIKIDKVSVEHDKMVKIAELLAKAIDTECFYGEEEQELLIVETVHGIRLLLTTQGATSSYTNIKIHFDAELLAIVLAMFTTPPFIVGILYFVFREKFVF